MFFYMTDRPEFIEKNFLTHKIRYLICITIDSESFIEFENTMAGINENLKHF